MATPSIRRSELTDTARSPGEPSSSMYRMEPVPRASPAVDTLFLKSAMVVTALQKG